MKKPLSPELRQALVELGRIGGKKGGAAGGKARAKALGREGLSKVMRRASKARWKKWREEHRNKTKG